MLGGFLTVGILGAYGLALYWLELETGAAVTVAFLTLALGHLWTVINLRALETGLVVNDVSHNRYVRGAIVLCLCLIGLELWLTGLSGILKLEPSSRAGLALAAGASILPLLRGQAWLVWKGRAGAN
ncbi:cation transporting ATPase C-terminal domain-containing protein [Ruegeria marina]|uniref:Cation transporting ATPase, C-terminus n=1 Tax=Ruegeria marina TaxID=639004 RepID=A0A1G6I6T5_9RHOB|nr:cation transporting ATPase C-terminal domain-containing protein [Ruegeria marina]SDC02161.1 Cation transporting ATPase, C-terminus [Ruegeria marina]